MEPAPETAAMAGAALRSDNPPGTSEELSLIQSVEDASDTGGRFSSDIILRFLRANNLDVQKSAESLKRHAAWREKWQPDSIRISDLQSAMDSGTWRFLGLGHGGSPVIWVQVGLWNPHEYPVDMYIRYISFFMGAAERMMKPSLSNKIIILFDMAGWAVWHARYISYIQELIDIAQSQYPERLGQAVMLHVPTVFKATWYTLSGFIDKRTREKVHFISDNDIATAVEKLISTELVPIVYGGEADGSNIPVPNCPDSESS